MLLFDVQLQFIEQAHEGAQLKPSLCHLWVMSQLPHPWGGFNHYIFFNAHFLSVNVFQGEGGVVCKETVVNMWGGCKSR